MSERILVAVAWPYANGSIHLGQVAGAYLPADIFARYHRMKGNDVLMVSGSDAHGTPVTLTAEQRGISPEEVSQAYQAEFLDNWERLGIQFDLFTSTGTENHAQVSQDIFLRLHEQGYIYEAEMTMLAPESPPEANTGPDTDPIASVPGANDLTSVVSQDPVYAGTTPPQVEPSAPGENASPVLAAELYAEPAPAAAVDAPAASAAQQADAL
ncbi:MAG: class I tRNA ligase family protein, partial [Chloroflexi bacterium]|nr:class I tRNA ligase family protein [Chloroflexota bacterium]